MPFTRSSAGLNRLKDQFLQSRADLRDAQIKRREFISEYCGAHYGKPDGGRKRNPRNLMEQAVTIYTMYLAGGIPQTLVKTDTPKDRIFASQIQAVINAKVREIGLTKTLQRLVMDAYFSVGIAKVGLDFAGDVDRLINDDLALEPFVGVVHLDDWVQDMRVPQFEECEFTGDRYRVPMDLFKELRAKGYYSKKAAGKVTETQRHPAISEVGEMTAASISLNNSTHQDTYRPYCYLWDLWLPDEQLVVTVWDDQPTLVLREVEWDGPECGMYSQLGFQDVPDNALPLPPAASLYDYHLAVNQLNRKMIDQANRQKTIIGYGSGAEGDASRGRDAQDGDLVRFDNPQDLNPVSWPGVDQTTQAFALYAESRFDMQAGNLNTLGGISTGADTLGQEELLASQAGNKISFMKQRTQMFTEGIIRDLGTRWWQNPVETYRGRRRVGEFEFDFEVTPEERDTQSLSNFSINIEPFSMTFQGPEERLQYLTTLMQQVLIPSLPLIQAQGGQLKMDKFLEIAAEYRNMPEIRDLVEFGAPVEAGDEARKPANTTRTENRISKPGASQRGNDATMQQLLSGGNPQQSEQAALGRTP